MQSFYEMYRLLEVASMGEHGVSFADIVRDNNLTKLPSELYMKLKNNVDLNSKEIKLLLDLADQKNQMAQFLGFDMMNKLEDADVRNLIFDQKDESVRDALIDALIGNKKKLTSDNVRTILVNAENPIKTLEKLGEVKLNLLQPHDYVEVKRELQATLDGEDYRRFMRSMKKFREKPSLF